MSRSIRAYVMHAPWLLACSLAQAHEGHGAPGATHWHASDALVFAAVAVGMVWFAWGRRK